MTTTKLNAEPRQMLSSSCAGCLRLRSTGAACRLVGRLLLFVLLLAPLVRGGPVLARSMYRQEAIAHLQRYGYLADSTPSEQTLERALQAFQRIANIPESGQIDTETIAKMQSPRCSVKDVDDAPTTKREKLQSLMSLFRTKRFILEGSSWKTKDIPYTITTPTTWLDSEEVYDMLREAFQLWEEHSDFRFRKETNLDDKEKGIRVGFFRREHGDGSENAFDGRGGVLAHSFFPRYDAAMHFDDDEPWGVPPMKKGLSFFGVAAHEIGHTLGLKHSNLKEAIMNPYYIYRLNEVTRLHEDDIQGLEKIYGKPSKYHKTNKLLYYLTRSSSSPTTPSTTSSSSSSPSTTSSSAPTTPTIASTSVASSPSESSTTTTSTTTTTASPAVTASVASDVDPEIRSSGAFDICTDPTIDAITTFPNGTTYAFKGAYYWRLNERNFDNGFPRRIADDWPGLPDDIDSALTDYENITYIFKGDRFWAYDQYGRMFYDSPKMIVDKFVGTPSGIDAATLWSDERKPYFFKGGQYWLYSKYGMLPPWPQGVKQIAIDLPSKIDAALKWTNGNTYLFAGRQYYRLTSGLGGRQMRVAPDYPRSIGEWWFGCRRPEAMRMGQIKEAIDYRNK